MAATVVIARNTLRECLRAPLPYVVITATALIAAGSRALLALSFGAAETEAANIVISAGFLAALAHAALSGTALIAREQERGTLTITWLTGCDTVGYVAGRFFGLFLATTLVLAAAAVAAAGAVGMIASFPPLRPALTGLLAACAPVAVLCAAALFASTILPRAAGAVGLLALVVAGGLAGGFAGRLLPDLGLFGMEAGQTAPLLSAAAYGGSYTLLFLALTDGMLAARTLRASRTLRG